MGTGFTAHTTYQTPTANVLATYSPTKTDRFIFRFINNDMYPNLSIRLSLNQYNLNPYQKGCAGPLWCRLREHKCLCQRLHRYAREPEPRTGWQPAT